MDKASIIKAVKDVSIIVIAMVVAYFIINAIEKKKCNCNPQVAVVTDENGDEVVVTTDTGTRK